ncbi:Type II secretion system protein G precursor [Gimesia panareensis]|uniref:Type II secretion system protein G n=1 Tax=Gimesia panareensis TaxID=2527978 RepID=A0A518FX17_9PLAN|nr:prepilin-type N-terminal cleavage/methylation domain-containing protein [Gimesia panareensis]QDV20935.1 Type II secretion system protein G precursor [Gimesia panareensis]
MKNRSPNAPSASQHNRRAFTLIELMIVIVIILILIGLLVPAIGAVRLRAQQSQVRTEIANLDAALTSFKADFGIYPPSYIKLYESGGASWDQHSKALVRKMWPQFNFALPKDINNDGDQTDVFELNAGECLVFFLGGVWDTTNKTPNGFSKNPANPFLVATGGTNRRGPYFEFDSARFTDIDGDSAAEYKDAFPGQQVPYMYFSSYDGRGYRKSELPSIPALGINMTEVYHQGTPGQTLGPVYKPKSYQIISAGADGQLGFGGNYDPDKNFPSTPDDRTVEADNITNFSSGALK